MSCVVFRSVVLVILLWCPVVAFAADTVCVECHSGQPGALGEPVAAWRSSVHAAKGISCHDCHGGDPTNFALAMSPERGFIGAPEYDAVPAFCGRCHVGVLDAYLPGMHGQALDAGGAQCVICHGSHSVQKAGLELINENDCSRCHDYDRALEIKESLTGVDTRIKAMDHDLERLHRLGFATDSLASGLFNLRNQFHRIFHGVDVERVRQESGGVQTELDQLASAVEVIDDTLAQRKLWGSIVIALFVLAGVVLVLVRKTYEEEEQG